MTDDKQADTAVKDQQRAHLSAGEAKPRARHRRDILAITRAGAASLDCSTLAAVIWAS